jgi:hypothetical protein
MLRATTDKRSRSERCRVPLQDTGFLVFHTDYCPASLERPFRTCSSLPADTTSNERPRPWGEPKQRRARSPYARDETPAVHADRARFRSP